MNTPPRSCPGFPVTLSRLEVGAPVHGTRLRLLGLLLALALPSVVRAQFTYTINSGAVTITRYESFDDTAIIPTAIGGLPVTGIAEEAFARLSWLVSVSIPSSVTNIGSYAFSVCYNLTNTAVATANPAYSSADGVLFNKNQTTLLQCPGGKTDSYTVPGTVTNIAVGAFSCCASLTNISLPGGLISLGDDAFSWCASLAGIAIPVGVARLGDAVFAGCTSLTDVTLPGSLTNIGAGAFSDCGSLTAITLPAGLFREALKRPSGLISGWDRASRNDRGEGSWRAVL